MPSLEGKHGYTYVGSFHEGLATAFLKGDGWYHVDQERRPAYTQRYTHVGYFSHGLACATLKGKEFHIRPNGKPAYDERFDYVTMFDDDGHANAYLNGEWFYITSNGQRID